MVSDRQIYLAWRRTAKKSELKDLAITNRVYKFKGGMETAFFTSRFYDEFQKTARYKKLMSK
jgi:hypothetical protein